MNRLLALFAVLLLLVVPAGAARLISGVSNDTIQITSSFDGERLTFYGTIAPDAGSGQRVIDGPFVNFQGVVEDINPERGRMKVVVPVFGRPTPVELEYYQVERL